MGALNPAGPAFGDAGMGHVHDTAGLAGGVGGEHLGRHDLLETRNGA
jgi:hypothetical protein